MGFSAITTKQYDLSTTLAITATDAELVALTDHKSTTVRVYAFDLLLGRKYAAIRSILDKHLTDNQSFRYRSGCLSTTNRVNHYFLSRLLLLADREKTFVLTTAEIEYYKKKINEVKGPGEE